MREGVVKNITDFGAFIDLGGLDASLGFAADLTFNGNGDGSDNDTLEIQNGSGNTIIDAGLAELNAAWQAPLDWD